MHCRKMGEEILPFFIRKVPDGSHGPERVDTHRAMDIGGASGYESGAPAQHPFPQEDEDADQGGGKQHKPGGSGEGLQMSRDHVPGFPGGYPYPDQNGVPEEASKRREDQKGKEIHPGEACRNGDQAADHGDKAAEEDGLEAGVPEPVHRFVHVLRVEAQELPSGAGEQGFEPGRRQQKARAVKNQSADDRACGGGQNDQPDIQRCVGGHEASEGQDDLRGDGRKNIFDSDQQGYAGVTILLHDSDDPVLHKTSLSVYDEMITELYRDYMQVRDKIVRNRTDT